MEIERLILAFFLWNNNIGFYTCVKSLIDILTGDDCINLFISYSKLFTGNVSNHSKQTGLSYEAIKFYKKVSNSKSMQHAPIKF